MEISVFIREYAPLAGEAGRAFRIDRGDLGTGGHRDGLGREYALPGVS